MLLPRRLPAVAFAVTVSTIPARSQVPENEAEVFPVEEEPGADANGQPGTGQSAKCASDDISCGFLRDGHRVTGPFNLNRSFRVRPGLDLGAIPASGTGFISMDREEASVDQILLCMPLARPVRLGFSVGGAVACFRGRGMRKPRHFPRRHGIHLLSGRSVRHNDDTELTIDDRTDFCHQQRP